MRPVFDPAWEALARRYLSQAHWKSHALRAGLRLGAPRGADIVVDLATDTGELLRALAGLCPRPALTLGVDRSAGMLARVGALPTGWSTVLADARSVPIPTAVADLVICSYLLARFEPEARAAVLAEARRLLRPDPAARLVVVTAWADRRVLGGRVLHRALEALADTRPSAWGGLAPLDPTDDLLAAGFRPDRRIVLTHGGYPSLVVRALPHFATPPTTRSVD